MQEAGVAFRALSTQSESVYLAHVALVHYMHAAIMCPRHIHRAYTSLCQWFSPSAGAWCCCLMRLLDVSEFCGVAVLLCCYTSAAYPTPKQDQRMLIVFSSLDTYPTYPGMRSSHDLSLCSIRKCLNGVGFV